MGRQRKVWLTSFAIFVIACAGFWSFAAWRDRAASLTEAKERVMTMARLLQEHAERAIESGDNLLQAVAEITRAWDSGDPSAHRAAFERVRELTQESLAVTSAWVLDPDGNKLVDSWEYPPQPGNFTYRRYFRVHREGYSGLLIGSVATGTVTGQPRFTLSRPLVGPEGGLLGVVAAGVDSAYFRQVYQDAGLGMDAKIRLFSDAGELLAAWPKEASAEDWLATLLRNTPEGKRSGLLEGAEAKGRIVAFRHSPRFPIVVTAGIAADDALAEWRTRTLWGGIIAVAAIAGFAVLVAMGFASIRREAAARHLLEAANEQLEDRVRRRTTELDALYKDSPIGLALFSRDLRFLRVNQRLAEINGLSVEDHAGRPLREIVPGVALAKEPHLRHVLTTGEPVANVEVRGETAKMPGVERVFIEDFYPVTSADGELWAAGAIVREVTDQVHIQEALQASEARYRALTEAIASVVWTTAPDGTVIDIPEWRALTGQTPEEVRGWGWLEALHPDDRERTRRIWEQAVDARGPYDTEYRVKCSSGEYRWYNAGAVPVLEPGGAVREWVGVCIDITERKRAEERQSLLMAELDHRVRNILASIQSMITLTGAQEGSRQEFADTLRGRIGAMARTLSLLTLSRWDGASLEQIVRDELHPYEGADRITVERDRDYMLRPKQALTFALVVHELATNAAKYGSLSVAEGRLRVSWRRISEDGEVRLRLTWEESGGPPVEAPDRRGFGSILIEKTLEHDADAGVDLTFGRAGVRCVIELPLETMVVVSGSRRRESVESQPLSPPSALPPTKVLVAEDEVLVAMSLERALVDAGLEVVGPAASLARARELVKTQPVGAAVLDTNLQGEMVFPLAEELVARGVPVLLVTGYGNDDILPPSLRAIPRLQKPASERDLIDRLCGLIRRTPAA